MIDLLKSIYESGEKLCELLREGELEEFSRLIYDRADMMYELRHIDRSQKLTPEWKVYTEKLEAQHRVLSELIDAHNQKFLEAITGLSRLSAARRTYTPAHPAGQLLRKNVFG